MKIKEIASEIYSNASKSSKDFHRYFSENGVLIQEEINNLQGVKSNVFVEPGEDVDWIKFSTIFSDITSVYLTLGKGVGTISLFPQEQVGAKDLFISRELYRKIINIDKPSICMGYVAPTDEELSSFTKRFEPLIKSGWILVRPRTVFFYKKTMGEKANWQGLDIDPNSPENKVIVLEDAKQKSLPIKFGERNNTGENVQFELSIPYIDGISLVGPYASLGKPGLLSAGTLACPTSG